MIEEIAITKIADVIFEKYRKLQDEKEDKTITVKFDNDKFPYVELDSNTTVNEEFNKDAPSLTFDNPHKKSCKVKEISFVPDGTFKTKGMIEIFIQDEIIYKNKNFGNFANVSQVTIPLNGGTLLKPNESVKIYLKSSDGASVGIAAQITFGA